MMARTPLPRLTWELRLEDGEPALLPEPAVLLSDLTSRAGALHRLRFARGPDSVSVT
jgi:hypothetical protein